MSVLFRSSSNEQESVEMTMAVAMIADLDA